MSTVQDVLTSTAQIIASAVPELTTYDTILPTLAMPAAVAFPPDRVGYSETFDDDGSMLYVVRLFVQRTQDGQDQQRLNKYISPSGVGSVVAAISANPRLNGVVADARVVEAVNYGNWPVGSQTFLGVELRIQVMLG